MALLDTLMEKAGTIDINGLAQRVGLDPAQVRRGMEALLQHLSAGKQPDEAVDSASSQTGIGPDKLRALLPAIQNALGGEGGIAGKLNALLDQDGDGNPANEIAGFAKGLFGKG